MFESRQSQESNWGPCGGKAHILQTAPTKLALRIAEALGSNPDEA